MHNSISVEQRVAIALWFVAMSSEYHTIANLFRVGRSTVCKIVHETWTTVVDCLLKQYIQFLHLQD